MKTRTRNVVLLALIVSIWPLTAWSQNSAIPNSAFNMGFSHTSAGNSAVDALTGEALAGITRGANTVAVGGFLAVVIQRESLLGLETADALPGEFALHQNYPNPFNPSTTLSFDLPRAADIRVVVYDLLGREVVRLVEGREEAGYRQVVWNGRDRRGRALPSGMYIVRMMAPGYSRSIKMLLLK